MCFSVEVSSTFTVVEAELSAMSIPSQRATTTISSISVESSDTVEHRFVVSMAASLLLRTLLLPTAACFLQCLTNATTMTKLKKIPMRTMPKKAYVMDCMLQLYQFQLYQVR